MTKNYSETPQGLWGTLCRAIENRQRKGAPPGLGSPGARKMHAGKYEESTSSRQRGGSGIPTPLPSSPQQRPSGKRAKNASEPLNIRVLLRTKVPRSAQFPPSLTGYS